MKLFFRKYGSGHPVIILHGLLGLSDNWITFAKRLTDEFEVFIPDQRNHGQSPHSNDFNYNCLTEDLALFIQEQNIIHPIIIGHSMGGKVAMNFALHYPTIAEKLIIVDIAPKAYDTKKILLGNVIHAMKSFSISSYHSFAEVENALAEKVPELRFRQLILKNIYLKDRILEWKINLNVISKNLHSIFEAIESKNTYNNPTLFIRGGLSDFIKEKDYSNIYQLFPKAQFSIIPHASHWVYTDAPEDFFSTVVNFLYENNRA